MTTVASLLIVKRFFLHTIDDDCSQAPMVVYVAVVATKQYNKLLITRVYLKHWEYIFNLTFTTIGQWNGNMASFASARQMAGTENDVYRTS